MSFVSSFYVYVYKKVRFITEDVIDKQVYKNNNCFIKKIVIILIKPIDELLIRESTIINLQSSANVHQVKTDSILNQLKQLIHTK